MRGYTGTILRVNLSNKTVCKQPTNMKLASDYIGGRGLGTKMYVDEVSPDVDPFSPENKILFMTGPLTGTIAPCSGRYEVITKSPLTGTIGAANSGGHFGPELKFAGYDGIVFEGKSDSPVYLYIDDDNVQIKSAEHVWGKTVFETTDILINETFPDARVACIGPSSENLNYFGCVMNDKNRAAGRGGLGAVMGSKNLKAVVVHGTKGVKVADNEGFFKASVDARAKLKLDPIAGAGMAALGTICMVNIVNAAGGHPVRNYRDGAVYEHADDVSGETLAEKYLVKNRGCFGCVISCGRVVRIKDGPYKSVGEGPEYEAAWSFGASCGVRNLEAVCKANFLCNEYGVDCITMGATIACAMELFSIGAITEKEVGRKLEFGDAQAIVDLTEMTGKHEGFGKELALGSYRLAEKYGHPELSMSVKKQELPAYDPRAIQGMGLGYATSNRGGCHVRGYMNGLEVCGDPYKLDPLVTEGKAASLIMLQDNAALTDSLGNCDFTHFGTDLPEFAEQYRRAVGSNETDEQIKQKGERIWNLEKLFNIKAGVEKDTLPDRLLKEPLPEGPAKGMVNMLDVMLKEYYELRGWDAEGIPTTGKLTELGL